MHIIKNLAINKSNMQAIKHDDVSLHVQEANTQLRRIIHNAETISVNSAPYMSAYSYLNRRGRE